MKNNLFILLLLPGLLLECSAAINASDVSQEIYDAAEKGDAAQLKQLLMGNKEQDPDCSIGGHFTRHRYGPNGFTPLMCAARKCHRDACEALLNAGANPNACDSSSGLHTPLSLAAKGGCDSVIQLLRSWKADINGNLVSPLVFALRSEEISTVKTLLEAGADPNNTYSSVPPVCYAAKIDSPEALKLLKDFGADLGRQDQQGNSALHVAAEAGSDNAVAYLVKNGQNVNQQSNPYVGTPMHAAARECNMSTVELLRKLGADFGLKTKTGETAEDFLRKCPSE